MWMLSDSCVKKSTIDIRQNVDILFSILPIHSFQTAIRQVLWNSVGVQAAAAITAFEFRTASRWQMNFLKLHTEIDYAIGEATLGISECSTIAVRSVLLFVFVFE